MSPTLKLRQIEVDYPEWVNPFAAPTRKRLDEFATKYQLYSALGLPQRPMLRAHSAVNDYMFPRVGPERLYVTGLMMVYFFIFDQIYDADTQDSTQLHDIRGGLAPSILAILDGRSGGSSPLERAITEILASFDSEDPAWIAGFSSRLRCYVEATLLGKDAALTRPETSLDEYLEIRQHDSGGLWSAYLIEYAHGRYLTPAQRADPEVLGVSQLCMWICSLLNDLFSYAKEKVTEVAPFNAVNFAMTSKGLDEHGASRLVCDRINRYLAEFESQVAAPVFRTDEAIVSYVQGLREFISGVWFWHQKCELYTDPRSLFLEMRGGPIPSLARCSSTRSAALSACT